MRHTDTHSQTPKKSNDQVDKWTSPQYRTSGFGQTNQTKIGARIDSRRNLDGNLTGILIGSWVRPYKEDELIDVLLTELDLPNTQTSLSKKALGLGVRVGDWVYDRRFGVKGLGLRYRVHGLAQRFVAVSVVSL